MLELVAQRSVGDVADDEDAAAKLAAREQPGAEENSRKNRQQRHERRGVAESVALGVRDVRERERDDARLRGGAGAEVPFLSIAASASVRWVFARTLVRSASSEPGIPEFSVEPHRCGASFQSFLSRRQGDFCRRQAIFWSPSAGRRVP